MTRKEKAVAEICRLKNELKAIRGEEPDEITDEYIRATARRSTEYKLKCDIEDYTEQVRRAGIEKEITDRREAFYATPEGQRYKDARDLEKFVLKNKANGLREQSIATLEAAARAALGNDWGIKNFYDGGCDLAVKVNGEFVFGSVIELRYDEHYFLRGERYDASVGTMGSFGVQDDRPDGRAAFYIGLGLFLSNPALTTTFKAVMADYAKAMRATREALQEIERKLNNPEIPQEESK